METERNAIMPRRLVFILCALILAACQSVVGCASQPTPIDTVAVKNDAAATAFVQLTEAVRPTAAVQTAIATLHTAVAATISSQPTKKAIEATATVAPTPSLVPNQTPPRWWKPTPLDPTKIPGLLQSSLSVETLETFNGHTLKWVTGWERGVMDFSWMDASHLLLYPIVGETTTARKPNTEILVNWTKTTARAYIPTSRPAVINLNSNKVWVPFDQVIEFFGHELRSLPRWSAQLGVLLAFESENSIGIYRPDGKLINTYHGNLVGISPNATKLIMTDGTWIDLNTRKQVHFGWKQDYIPPENTWYYFRAIWSPDETRVSVCCYVYGDAKTGQSYSVLSNEITIDGEKIDKNYITIDNLYGTWVLNNTYMLSQWGGQFDLNPGFVPLFDPSAKTYRNLNKLASIPTDSDYPGVPNCTRTYATPGGQYVWLECDIADYLVDLTTFKSTSYPPYPIWDINWSTGGKFAMVHGEEMGSQSFVRLLSVDTKELKPLPDNHYCPWWHPTDDILACQSKDARTLLLLDARTISVQKEIALPVEIQDVIWSPDGKRMALLAKDGSLWQVDYPSLENLEQLTSAMPGSSPAYPGGVKPRVSNVLWSPDGNSLAFIGDLDIYIVDTQAKP
jgi:hypothetical protein